MSHRRILKLQKNILMMIRAEVRKTLGEQPRELRRYYEAYKREFRVTPSHSSRADLIEAGKGADIILIGDYHTFSQSQRSALRLMNDLHHAECNLALGVELVRSSDQSVVDSFLSGAITEEIFLSKLDYARKWGFPWQNFKPLFEFAKANGFPVLALNADSDDLSVRDAHAAQVISNYSVQNAKRKIVVLYGDLHLARGHIPKKLKAALAAAQVRRKVLTVFQNSESLYWRLAAQGCEHEVDVLKLDRERYCIISAAPWVKLQSYLQWAESSQLLDEGEGLGLQDLALQNIRHLSETLSVSVPPNLDFSVQTVNNLAFLSSSDLLRQLSRDELKAVKAHILSNRTIYIPRKDCHSHVVYLPSESVNAICEAASALLHSALSETSEILFDPQNHFFQNVLRNAIAYFGSKILNHKRKCDLEDDFRIFVTRPQRKSALRQEQISKKVARIVLGHCEAQRKFLRSSVAKYPSRLLPVTLSRHPSRLTIFLEVTRNIGNILGEKLYFNFKAGKTDVALLHAVYRTKLDGDADSRKKARALYFDLLKEVQDAPLHHSSKEEVF